MLLALVHVNINVTDIHRSLAFYQKIGFEVMHVFGTDLETGMRSEDRWVRGAVMGVGPVRLPASRQAAPNKFPRRLSIDSRLFGPGCVAVGA